MSDTHIPDGAAWAAEVEEGSPIDMVARAVSKALRQGCGEVATCELLPGLSLLVAVGNTDMVHAVARALTAELGKPEKGH